MESNLYILNFNDNLGTREQIANHLDTNKTNIQNWFYCMTNTIFIASTYSAHDLADFIKKLDKSKSSRFFVIKIVTGTDSWGWLPQEAHNFINQYVK